MPKRKITTCALVMVLGVTIPAQAEAPQLSKAKQNFIKAINNPKEYAQLALYKKGHTQKQWACLARLWGKESAWNRLADNPTSSAFGIAQMLGETSKNPVVQINNGLRYIEHRYKTPCNAWRFWRENFWY